VRLGAVVVNSDQHGLFTGITAPLEAFRTVLVISPSDLLPGDLEMSG
jgi:hypothetical protein